MNTEQMVSALDSSIQQHKDAVELGRCLQKLRSNADFKKVILNGYFEQEAIRLVHLKADPNMQTADKQESIIKQMDAIGAFAEYLNTLAAKAAWAVRGLESDEETRAELLEGGGEFND